MMSVPAGIANVLCHTACDREGNREAMSVTSGTKAESGIGETIRVVIHALIIALVIRTVLKDVSPNALGTSATLFHEHLSFEWARVRGPNGRGTLSGPEKDVTLVAEQINIAANEGVGCIVDAGTTDVGRDAGFLKQVA